MSDSMWRIASRRRSQRHESRDGCAQRAHPWEGGAGPRKPSRQAWVAWGVLGLLLPATAGAQGQPIDDAAAAARHYLLLIESWSRGTSPDAPRHLADFERALVGSGLTASPRGSRVRCKRALDDHVLESVSELEPKALLPLTLFYVDVFTTHATTGQRWLTSEARDRYRSVLRRFSQLSRRGAEAQRHHSQVLVASAVRLASQGYLALFEMARDAALDAVSLTPQSHGALYWAAYLEEKLGRHDKALALLSQLIEHHGDDPEIRLRRGVNLARRGREGAARLELLSVARGAHDAWRVLAYQELAQLNPKAGDPQAVAVLDEALEVFSDDPGLRLLASFHGRPIDPLLDGLPASPRLRYEMVGEAVLVAAESYLTVELAGHRELLNTALAEIRRRLESDETAEDAFRSCRGLEPAG